jgi:hypothetical protein
MAHIINLATQVFMGEYSTTAHYDPSTTNDNLEPACNDDCRDEIGLVCTIAVKVGQQEWCFSRC